MDWIGLDMEYLDVMRLERFCIAYAHILLRTAQNSFSYSLFQDYEAEYDVNEVFLFILLILIV